MRWQRYWLPFSIIIILGFVSTSTSSLVECAQAPKPMAEVKIYNAGSEGMSRVPKGSLVRIGSSDGFLRELDEDETGNSIQSKNKISFKVSGNCRIMRTARIVELDFLDAQRPIVGTPGAARINSNVEDDSEREVEIQINGTTDVKVLEIDGDGDVVATVKYRFEVK